MIRIMCGVRLVDSAMVMPRMETSIPKYVLLWKLKQLGKGRMEQENRGDVRKGFGTIWLEKRGCVQLK